MGDTVNFRANPIINNEEVIGPLYLYISLPDFLVGWESYKLKVKVVNTTFQLILESI